MARDPLQEAAYQEAADYLDRLVDYAKRWRETGDAVDVATSLTGSLLLNPRGDEIALAAALGVAVARLAAAQEVA